MLFCAGGEIGAAGCAFIVNHFAERLIQNFAAVFSKFERQVGVFVICRCVARIEAAGASKKRFRDHERRRRAVIHFPKKIIFWSFGVIELAIIAPGGIPPDNTAGFLQTSIGVNEL